MPTFRKILQLLPRADLLALADTFDVALPERRSKQPVVDALASSEAAPEDMLLSLSRDRLKELCLRFGLETSGRDKASLVSRLIPPKANDLSWGLNSEANEPLHSSTTVDATIQVQTATDILARLLAAMEYSRGLISDPLDAKTALSVLLLLKRINDVFDEEVATLLSDGAPIEVAFDDIHEHDVFVPVDARWFHLETIDNHDLGDKLNHACSAIESANGQLRKVLTLVDFKDERRFGGRTQRVKLLRYFVDTVSALRLGDSQISGTGELEHAYTSFLETTANPSSKRIGSAVSPQMVVRLMAELLSPQEGMSVCDPVCGTGSTLIACAEYVERRGGDSKQLRLEGQERQTDIYTLARINLFIHGLNAHRIELGDTIRDPQLITGTRLSRYDRVIANPPFSLRWWGHDVALNDSHERFRYGIPPRDHGDFAFLQHMVASLKPEGRLVTTTPHGVLFRGKVEGRIRAGMLQDDLFEAVIGLPGGLFLETSEPTALLIIQPQKPAQRKGRILFIDASQEFHEARPWNQLRTEDLSKILMTFREFTDVPHYARVVDNAEIVANDFSLAINRYVEARTPNPEDRLDNPEQMWRRIELKNYKSIAQTRVELAPFTVVIGPNGSGKSNFADAFVFAREVATDAETALARRGGIQGLCRRQTDGNADILVDIRTATSRSGLETDYLRHHLTIRNSGTRGWSFRSETIELFSRGEPIFRIERSPSGVEIEPTKLAEPLRRLPKLNENASAMVFARQLAVMAPHKALRDVTRIRLNPDVMRSPQSATENTRLDESGSNIAVAFRGLDNPSQEQVLLAMQRIVPGLLRIFVEPFDRYLLLRFEQQSADQVAAFSVSEMSEGALRALGILVATQQMTRDELLIIEEPETAIHLGAARLLFDILKDASTRGSVLIITHSADLLDAAQEEEILVCSYREGATQIGPLASSQREIVKQGLFSVAELMRSEPLRIEGEEPEFATP